MTLDDIFGSGNVSVSTVSGKTRVTLKRSAFPLISAAEANASTGDIRKVVYGIMVKFGQSIDLIKSDATQTNIIHRETYADLYPEDDIRHTKLFDFYIDPLIDDVKNEP